MKTFMALSVGMALGLLWVYPIHAVAIMLLVLLESKL